MKGTTIALAVMVLACLVCGCEEEFGVRKVSPPMGVLAGGEPIEILGSGFKRDMGITVYFGTTKTDTVAINGPEKLTVMSPSAEAVGKVDILIITDGGIELRLPGAFTYVEKSNMDIRDLGKRKSLRD